MQSTHQDRPPTGSYNNLNIFRSIETTKSISLDHNGIHDINDRKISGKPPNSWKLSNILLNNPWAKEQVSKAIRKCFQLNENEYITYHCLCG